MRLPFLSDSSLASKIFVDFLAGLMHPLGTLTLVGGRFVTPTPPFGAECAMVFFVPSLPATSFSHPSPRPISQCLDPIKSSTHLKTAWFASSYFCCRMCGIFLVTSV